MSLDGRVAVITGGAQGLGRAFAAGFAAARVRVVVADLDEGRAAEAAAGLPGGALGVGADVGSEASVQAMAARVLEECGRIDILVNNAAIFSTLEVRPFDQIPLAEWARVLEVNVTGVFLCCKAVAPAMRAAGFGRIVNIASAAARMGRPNYLHYIASKGAVEAMTRSLARELGPHGITANAICPGAIFTEVPRKTVSEAQKAAILAAQCVPRPGAPADVVSTALYLAQPASGFVTGQCLVVDGGVVHG